MEFDEIDEIEENEDSLIRRITPKERQIILDSVRERITSHDVEIKKEADEVEHETTSIKKDVEESERDKPQRSAESDNKVSAASLLESDTIEQSNYELKISLPMILETPINSENELKSYIVSNIPGFLERKDLSILLESANSHFEILKRYKHIIEISYSDLEELAKEHGLAINTLKRWLLDGKTPMIYNMLENAITIDIGHQRIQEILNLLNGLENWSDVNLRLKTLYMYDILNSQTSFESDCEQAKSYFRFLKQFAKGGLLPGIAKRAGVAPHQVRSWYYCDIIPRLIRIASQIPQEKPRRSNRWLPLVVKSGQNMGNFIQVPVRILHPKDIHDVLNQLTSLDTSRMTKWKRQFGNRTSIGSLMYFLGVLFSDGFFSSKGKISTESRIKLGKVYYWSKDMGEAFSYNLGQLGFKAERREDSVGKKKNGERIEFMNWGSVSSPFFIWVKHVLFGLEPSQTKSNTPIVANWILNMTEEDRTSFIQGVADGDGYVILAAVRLAIASKNNQDFLKDVLNSLGIKSRSTKNGVLIEKESEIKKAANFQFFRHASERRTKLDELVKMLTSPRGGNYTEQEREDILHFAMMGLSPNEITLKLWEKTMVFRRPQGIRDFLRRIRS